MNEEMVKAFTKIHRENCVADIISLLRSVDCLYNDFFKELSSNSLDNVAELGVRLDAINRFGHCIMEKITEEDFTL